MNKKLKRNRIIAVVVCMAILILAGAIWGKTYLQQKEQERVLAEQKEAEKEAEKQAEIERQAEIARKEGEYYATLGGESPAGNTTYSLSGMGTMEGDYKVIHRYEVSDTGITLWGMMSKSGENGEEVITMDGTYFEFADDCKFEAYYPDLEVIDKADIATPFVGESTESEIPYLYGENIKFLVENGKVKVLEFSKA